MSVLPPRRALAALAGALVVALAWQGGRMSAGGPMLPEADPDAFADGGDEAAGPGPLERLAAERDVALAAAARLERRLDEAERAAEEGAAELALYRRIESGAAGDGLSIETVRLEAPGTPDAALAVTLVQSRGRHRVTGSLSARLLDGGAGGGAGDGPAAGAGAGAGAGAAGEGVTPLGDGPAAFDLRFFQTVRVPLGAAADRFDAAGEPPRVELEVAPAGDRHERFVEIRSIDPTVAVASGE